MENIHFNPVGIVVNDFTEVTSHHEIKTKPSKIIINDNYTEAMLNIEDCEYIDIIFYLHAAENKGLSGKTASGDVRGVFASRSPYRPNPIGVTTVRLKEIKDNMLLVEGLDAINNTPVLDIKCCDTSLFASVKDSNPVHNAILKSDPRIDIKNYIRTNKTDILLLKSGVLHGHFCPGLAMGVMAATHAMNVFNTDSDGMENVLAIIETNNCFSDGVQFVTGCSFGNNALIFHDTGKTAFTIAKRDGKGIRISSKNESREIIQQNFPDFQNLYQQVVVEQIRDAELVAAYKRSALNRAFGTLSIPFDKLFEVQRISVDIPSYASIQESVICSGCNESVMQSRSIRKNNRYYCYPCSGEKYPVLDGNGIHC